MGNDLCIEYDPEKNAKNIRKHGIDFDTASQLLNDPNMVEIAMLYPSEPRWMCIGCVEGRAYLLIMTRRGDCIRIISAWRYSDKTHRSLRNKRSEGLLEIDEADMEYLDDLIETGC